MLRSIVLDHVDQFINAYLSVNPAPDPSATTVPQRPPGKKSRE
jgi:hypothetical protein